MSALISRRTSDSHHVAPATVAEAASSSAALGSRVRIHITPFNPDLLPKIIPPSQYPDVSNLSFHRTLVSPDKGFGYVELPLMAADKLKKKLNGAILKGEKVKVQNAKPEKRAAIGEQDPLASEQPPAVSERPERKKRKVTEKVESGVELPEGRSVKRGWTESSTEKKQKRERTAEEKQARKAKKEDKKKRESSKYTEEPELLFKAKLEPTAATSKSMEKKKSKDNAAKKEKGTKKVKDATIIHEFTNTRKHAGFLRENQVSGDSAMTTEYIEGKGWVDSDGNVVEADKHSNKRKPKQGKVDLLPSIELTGLSEDQQDHQEPASGHTLSGTVAAQPAVHPLEALYKRSKAPTTTAESTTTSPKKPPPIDTSKAAFSFFDTGSVGAEDEDGDVTISEGRPHLSLPPMTPKTKQDFHMRGLRSAAPEPDTATQERRFPFSEALDGIRENEEGDENEGDPDEDAEAMENRELSVDASAASSSKPESEFRKWFYENRGENNRAWRQKRREAMKVKRQRENRRLARRIIV